MKTRFVMGNEAIALGAIAAGVQVVTGYPGTPSTEVLENVVKHNPKKEDGTDAIYVEWSVNEKTAMEVGAGAAYAGARVMVTMKQVGLNVASDPLMSLAYVGVKGGMVILVADDPGPISSQTEQDTRTFAMFSKLPVFDPASPEEAYQMTKDAFELSEKYRTPVLLRPTTRVCHGYASMEIPEGRYEYTPEGFVKDPKWVIFPRLSYAAHKRIEEQNRTMTAELSAYAGNTYKKGSGRKAIAAGGVSYAYTMEALALLGIDIPLLKIGTPFPFPNELAEELLNEADEVLVLEELDPVIERALVHLVGKKHLPVDIRGKEDGTAPSAGENSVDGILSILASYLGIDLPAGCVREETPALPVRPPVLCAGCPHRASFYAVKQAMKGRKAVFCGDIGCYTLGNAMPLDMTDTCLCMGAGITVAQGIGRVEPDTVCFSFTGDSTFYHTGLPNLVNAVYNDAHMVAMILDNSTTAMTGHQPNPNTGKTAMGEVAEKIDIEGALRGIGITHIATVDPLDLEAAIAAVWSAADQPGASAIIFRSPCIALFRPTKMYHVDSDACIGCRKCLRELGCPGLVKDGGKKVKIDTSLCYSCGLCTYVCPTGAIRVKEDK
ncbi:MAG: indolepyruvate ferredoxin oxidoreductase subunit alpha [Clostridia bacterium]|nr:indolepyruvate ferredoxin oxidoreductase subunit alpha [Clostridia bacterium]